jgi:putative FmdB family regulatory protein
MPTYEYRCKDCGEELEAVQAFTDDPLTECPSCGGNLKKKFGSVGISFKGSGFYKNDSRTATTSGGSAKSEGSTSGADSGDSSSSSTSTSADSSSAGKSDGGSSGGAKSKEAAPT